MKKKMIISVLLVSCLTLCGCGSQNEPQSNNKDYVSDYVDDYVDAYGNTDYVNHNENGRYENYENYSDYDENADYYEYLEKEDDEYEDDELEDDDRDRQDIIDEYLLIDYPEDYEVNWPILWVVVDRLNADGTDENGNPVHVDISMSEEEKDYFLYDLSQQFKDCAEGFAQGNVNFEITPVVYDEITLLETDDNINSIVPNSFSDEFREQFRDYNTVIITCRFSEGDDNVVFHDWVGLCYGVIAEGCGFLEVPVFGPSGETEESYFHEGYETLCPPEIWIHEFIHSLEPLARAMGDTIPSPDDADKYGYKQIEDGYLDGFYEYYADILSGNVIYDNRLIGVDEDKWKHFGYAYEYYYENHE